MEHVKKDVRHPVTIACSQPEVSENPGCEQARLQMNVLKVTSRLAPMHDYLWVVMLTDF
jgi:hypothetical protein